MGRIRRAAGAMARSVRGCVRPRPVILCYHRVAELETDPQLLAVRPETFDRHMELVRRRAEPAPLRALVGRNGGRRVAVTFDDGYADNLETARPVLERYQVPATVFVVAGLVGSDEELWWDELERLLLCGATPREPLELEIEGRRFVWRPAAGGSEGPAVRHAPGWTVLDPTDPTPNHQLYRDLHAGLRVATAAARERAIDEVRRWVGAGRRGRPSHRVMGPDQLSRLADGGLVTIGSHGLRHLGFAGMSSDERRHELSESRRRLEAAVKVTVDEFAYPYGDRSQLPLDDMADLDSVGYRLACANYQGTVGDSTSPYRLPRMLVRDWPADELDRRLSEWFGLAPG